MESSMDMGVQMVKVAASLALVLGLLLLGLYGFKRLGRWVKKPQTGTWIQVVAQHPVGLKHYLMVVRVQDQLMLLGVSPQGIQHLSSLQGHAGPSPAAEDGLR